MKPVLPFVETMVTQVCNLSCSGCTNYSDLIHQGYVTWQQGRRDISKWMERVELPDFGIIGGEPLVNPEIEDWIIGIRDLLPNTQIRFTTNGLLLHKYPDIIKLFEQVGNCVFKITVHVDDQLVNNEIQKILDLYNWEPVEEFGIKRFRTKNNLRFQIKQPDVFYRAHLNEYHNMMPHHSDPQAAFKLCSQQTCPLLHHGKIYKCSSNGLLSETLERFKYPNIQEWSQYLSTGLEPDCSDTELQTFLQGFGKPEKICSMCPSEHHTSSRIIHFDHVKRKKND